MPRATILNSRQSKTPVGTDRWLKQTLRAVQEAIDNDWTVVSSIGMNTWELVTWAVGFGGGCLELHVPKPADKSVELVQQSIALDFGIPIDKINWQWMPSAKTGKSWWPIRDRTVIERSEILIPVSIRPNGRLDELICGIRSDQRINRDFETDYAPTSHHPRSLIDRTRLNPLLKEWKNDYLIHWTRTCHCPWPGETRNEFYSDMVDSQSYCRDAFSTLKRILSEKTIRASSWRIGDKRPMVAVTELSPLESIPLMKWRSRWSRWSFEPYAIAIHKDYAEDFAIRSVRYVSEDEWNSLRPDERPFAHRIGKVNSIWTAEREWRCSGDIDLSALSSEAMRVIVNHAIEASVVCQMIDNSVAAIHV